MDALVKFRLTPMPFPETFSYPYPIAVRSTASASKRFIPFFLAWRIGYHTPLGFGNMAIPAYVYYKHLAVLCHRLGIYCCFSRIGTICVAP